MHHSPELLALSQQPTPVLQLEEADSNASGPEPRVLFSPELHQPIELFQSRLYESFEVEKEELEWAHDLLFSPQALARRGSVDYFSEQLGELKRNIDRLLAFAGQRNPEEHEKSLGAKSTESQQLKEQSLVLGRSIAAFDSPLRSCEPLSDCSPIASRSPHQPSNVSETSTRSLMRRKMRLSAYELAE